MCKKKSWIVYQDHSPGHNILAMKQLLAIKCFPVLRPHPPHTSHSLDIPVFDFLPVAQIESALRGSHFQSGKVKLNIANLLSRVLADDLEHCYEQWKVHTQRYTDGEQSKLKRIEINKVLQIN